MRIYTTDSGLTIKVGENARENDLLIKTSHQDAVWCHLENTPSPHAIIYSSNPDNDSLNAAYQLVKYFSKQRNARISRMISTKVRNIVRVDRERPGLVELKKSPSKKSIKSDVSCLKRFGISA